MGSTLIGSIGWGISAGITLIITFFLFKSYLQTKEKNLKYFSYFFIFRFFLFFSITLAPIIYFLTKNLLIAGICITFLFVFIFLSLLFPPLIFLNFKWQKLKIYYMALILILVIWGIVLAVINFSPAIYSPENGYVFQQVPDILIKKIYPLTKILSVTPLSILFLVFAIKNTGAIRLRSILIGLGFVWILSTILVPTLIPIPWAGMYCCIGDILIFIGILIKPRE